MPPVPCLAPRMPSRLVPFHLVAGRVRLQKGHPAQDTCYSFHPTLQRLIGHVLDDVCTDDVVVGVPRMNALRAEAEEEVLARRQACVLEPVGPSVVIL